MVYIFIVLKIKLLKNYRTFIIKIHVTTNHKGVIKKIHYCKYKIFFFVSLGLPQVKYNV